MNKYLDLSGLSYFWDKIKSYAVKRITSTDNAVVRFDGTNGNVQNSDITIDDNNVITTPGDIILKNSSNGAATPKIEFRRGSNTDTYNDWHINTNSSGNLIVGLKASSSSATTKATLTSSGITFANALEASSIKKTGGTSSQFLKADGSVDSNTYINTSSTAQTKSGNLTANKFITSGGTSSQVVLGNGSLSDANTLPQKEAYLEWGGKNFSAGYGPIDAAMVDVLGANRMAFPKSTAIIIEYSRDGGVTWSDYEASDESKIGLFSGIFQGFSIGKSTAQGDANSDCQLRITYVANTAILYTTLNKFVIYVTTSGSSNCKCSIVARNKSDSDNNLDTWTTFAEEVGVSGWSGYNVINTSNITVGGQYYKDIRFIFTATHTSTQYHTGLTVGLIQGFGGVGWTTPSNMARNGHLYKWDSSQNAIFPNKITSQSFIKQGGTSSQFLKADGSVDSNTYSKEIEIIDLT